MVLEFIKAKCYTLNMSTVNLKALVLQLIILKGE